MLSQKLKKRSLVFPIEDNNILLGLKKEGQGSGNYNGFGGKFDSSVDKNILDTAKRELEEESKLVCSINDLVKVGIIDFYFPYNSSFDQQVHVYLWKKVIGTPGETDEMIPKWFSLSKVPYEKMWDSDVIWLKKILDNKKKIVGEFYWKEDNKTVDFYDIKEVDSF